MGARRLGHFEPKLDQQIEELIRSCNDTYTKTEVYTKAEADNKFVTFDALPPHGAKLFNTPGEHELQIPDNINVVWVTGSGGGGGGGGGTDDDPPINRGGGGGGGDAVYKKQVFVTPGETVPIYIGAGGTGGDKNRAGSAGGATSFGSYLTLPGGGGGKPLGDGGTPGGTGGSGGSTGEGGGSMFGSGGCWLAGRNGGPGSGFGGGGGGGDGEKAGGNGAPGFLLIEW